MLDRLDRRVLGGFRIIDQVLGGVVDDGLRIDAPGLTLARAGTGAWAVFAAPGMGPITRAFDNVPVIPAQNFDIEVHDRLRRYEPLAVTLTFPRDADPAAVTDRVDTPIDIELPSAPGRGTAAGWSTVTVEVIQPGGAPIRGALVQVFDQGTTNERGWTLTGVRGQAVVPLVGLQKQRDIVTPDNDDPDLDPQIATVTAQTSLDVRVIADITQPWPARPAALRAGGATTRTTNSTSPVQLVAGGDAFLSVTLDLS
ncbi:MAG: hypothetical protein AB8B71_12290 [Paracoccaceae bacterium]